MEEILKNFSLADIFIAGIFFGYISSMCHDVIISLTNYINEKAWRVNDYERIIDKYTILNNAEDNVEFEIISNAKISNKKRLEKRERLDKFLSKFRRKKDV